MNNTILLIKKGSVNQSCKKKIIWFIMNNHELTAQWNIFFYLSWTIINYEHQYICKN